MSGTKKNRASQTRPSTIHHGLRQQPTPILDDWRLTTMLGRGSAATVYAAVPLEQSGDAEADYAIKILDPALANEPDAIQRLVHEAALARRVTHPNLIAVLSARLQCQPYYLVLPRMRGATLAATLACARSCTVPRALWIARHVAQALSAIHEAGWLHLDVKPANIMLDPSGHCTLFDLDLSLPQSQSVCAASRDVRGSLAYTAPELFTSAMSAQPASDVYSLGVVLYQAVSGHLPFCCDSPGGFVEAHLRQIPPSVRSHQVDLPVEVSRLISRMLAKQPERRPSTQGELQDELARLEIATFGIRGGSEAEHEMAGGCA